MTYHEVSFLTRLVFYVFLLFVFTLPNTPNRPQSPTHDKELPRKRRQLATQKHMY